FSDGVGYSWIDTLKEMVEEKVGDEQLENAKFKFEINPPMNKEEYYYRTIFQEHFPSSTAAACVPSVPSVACSSPVALEWDESFKNANEPSGRAIKNIHNDGYE
ncbi:MAG: asparagine synthase B, partial [Flavobacteriales bacterium]|nr:asparagine synthase B [Flavobacteriales bacterium]